MVEGITAAQSGTPAKVVYGIIATVWIVGGGISLILFWRRRNLHPIKGRFPRIAFVSGILIAFWVINGCFTNYLITKNVPCFLRVVQGTWLVMSFVCYGLRAFILFISFRITEARLKDGHVTPDLAKWLMRANWIKPRFLYKLFLSALTIHFICGIVIVIDASSYDPCSHTSTDLYAVASILVYGTTFVVFAFKLRNCGVDGFGFKKELRTIGIASFVGCFIWFTALNVGVFQKPDREKFKYTGLIAFFFGAIAFSGTILVPLYKSYYFEKLLRKKRKSTRDEMSVSSKSSSGALGRVLSIQEGRDAFQEFLAREFAVENLKFWEEVEDFKEKACIQKEKQVEIRAIAIAKKYVLPGSMMEINLSGSHIAAIAKKLNLTGCEFFVRSFRTKKDIPLESVFDDAQLEIYKLMESDNFRRFRKSSIYQTYQHDTELHQV